MSSKIIAKIAGGFLLVFSLLPVTVNATVSNQATQMTFQQPVRIPGHILPPGTYWFTVPSDGVSTNLNNVRVSNADGTKVIADMNTATSDFAQFGQETTIDGTTWPLGKIVLTFAEGQEGQPVTLMDWYYPGQPDGHRFVYSSRRERQLNEDRHVTMSVPAGDTITVGRSLASFE